MKKNEHQLLHMQIKETILDEYRAGNIEPGAPFPSSRELIKRFNVSKVTMEKVFAELKKDNIVYSVPKVGMFWGEKKKITIYKTIGVRLGVRSLSYLTPDTYYFYMLQGMEDVFSRYAFHTKLLHYKSLDTTDGIRELACDAVICTGTFDPVLSAVKDFNQMNIPYLLLDRPNGDESLNYLERDSTGNIAQIVDYLVSQGHKKICAIGPSPDLWIYKKLYMGFEAGMKKHKLACSNSILQLSDFASANLGSLNFSKFLKRHSALIILSPIQNDIEAVMTYCTTEKIAIPNDCAVFTLAAADMTICGKKMTSHLITPHEMGVKAAEGIVGILENTVKEPLHIEFPLKITEGSTVNVL